MIKRSAPATPMADEMLDFISTGVVRLDGLRLAFLNRAATEVLGMERGHRPVGDEFSWGSEWRCGEADPSQDPSAPKTWSREAWPSLEFDLANVPDPSLAIHVYVRRLQGGFLLEITRISAPPVTPSGAATDLLRRVIDGVPGPVYVTNRDGILRLVNRATARGIGLPSVQIEGRDNRDLGLDREAVDASLALDFQVIDSGRARVAPEMRFRGRDGRDRYFELYKTPITLPDGERCSLTTGFPVSGRRRFRQSMEQRERMLRTIIDAVPAPLFVRDTNGVYRLANRAAAEQLGTTVAELEGRARSEISLDVGGLAERLRQDREVIETGEPLTVTGLRIAAAMGEEWFDIQRVPVDLPDGTRAALTATHRVTERRRLAGALERSERLLRSVVDAEPGALYVRDADGRFRLANSALAQLLGTEVDQLVGRRLEELPARAGGGLDLSASSDALVIERGERVHSEPAPATIEGSLRFFEVDRIPLALTDGSPAVLGVFRDVTEREEARQTAELKEREFRALVDQLPIVIYREEIGAGRVINEYVSPRRTDEEFVEGLVQDDRYLFVHPEDLDRVKVEDNRTDRTGEPFAAEYRLKPANGRVLWVRDEASLVRDLDGTPLYWRGYTWDITDRKLAEEHARQSEVFYRSLVEDLPFVTYRYPASDSGQQWISPQWEALAGFPLDGDIRQAARSRINAEDLPRVAATVAAAAESGEPYLTEYRMTRGSGAEIWLRDHAVLVRDQHGEPWYWQGYLIDITESRELHSKLEGSERFLRTILQTVPDTVFVKDSSARYVIINEAVQRSLGLDAGALLGRTMAEAGQNIDAATVEVNRQEDEYVLSTGRSVERPPIPAIIRGERLLVGARKVPITLPDGSRGILGVITDYTEREAAAAALARSEAFHQSLVENLPFVTYRIPAAGSDVNRYTSPQWESLLGMAHVDAIELGEYIHPDDRAAVLASDARSADRREPFLAEYRVIRADGEARWVRDHAALVENAAGDPWYWQGVIEDITDLKAAERRLAESEARYRTLSEHSPLAIRLLAADADGMPSAVEYLNPQFRALFGEDAGTIEAWKQRIHPDDLAGYEKLYGSTPPDVPFRSAFRVRGAHGEWRSVFSEAVAVQDDAGRTLSWLGVITDLTDLRRAEQLRAESENRYRMLAEHAPIPVRLFKTDSDGRSGDAVYLNPEFIRIFGEDNAGMDAWKRRIHPEDLPGYEAEDRRTNEGGGPFRHTYRVRDANGEWRWVAARGVLLRDSEGEPANWLTLVEDITAQRSLEDALRAREAQYRGLVENLRLAVYTLDAAGEPTYLSPQFHEMFGADAGTSEHWLDRVHVDDRERFRQARIVVDPDSYARDQVYRMRGAEGDWLWIRDRAAIVTDADRQPQYIQGFLLDVTQQKNAELALAESETRYRQLIEDLPLIIYTQTIREDGSAGDLAYVSGQYRQLIGRDRIGAAAWLAIVHPDDVQAHIDASAETDRTGEPYECTYRVRAADGAWHWLHDAARLIRSADGSPLYWQGFMLDVTAQKEAEEALRASELEHRTLVESLPIGIYRLGIRKDGSEAKLTLTNQRLNEMFGIPGPGSDWTRNIHPDDVARVVEEDHRSDVTLAPFASMYRITRSGGGTILVEDRGEIVRDAEGTPLYRQGYTIDVTAAEEAAARLRESEERYRSLVEELPAMVYMHAADEVGSTIYVSPRVESVFGYTAEEWNNPPDRFFNDILHPDDRERLRGEIDANNRGRRSASEYRCVTRDGRIVWIYDESNPMFDEFGNVIATRGFMLDVTARHEAEAALRASETRFRSLVESLPLAVYRYVRGDSGDLELEFFGSQISTGFGLAPSARLTAWLQSLHPDDRERAQAEWQAAEREGSTWRGEYRSVSTSGDVIWLMDYATLTRDESGRVIRMEGFSQDITERKLAEEMLSVFAGQQAAIAELSRAALSQELANVGDLATLAVNAIARAVGGERVLVFHVTDTGPRLLASRGWADPPSRPFEGDAGEMYQVTYTLRTGESVTSGDIPHDTRFTPAPEVTAANLRSSVSVVIPGKAGALGVIIIHAQQVNAFGGGASRFLESVAGVLGAALERQFAEEALTAANERMQTLISAAPLAITAVDAEGIVTTWNPAAETMYGWSAVELVGRPVPPELRAEMQAGLDAVYTGSTDTSVERRHVRRDGSEFDAMVSFAGLPAASGERVGLIALSEDVTDRKRAESELRLRGRALAAANNAILVIDARDPNLPVRSMNPAVQAMTGFTEAEVIGQHPRVLIRGPQSEAILAGLRRARIGGRPARVSFENERKDGSRYWIDLAMSPVTGEDGAVSHLVIVANDTTELVQRGEELRVAKQRLEGIIDASPLAIVSVDAERRVNQWNSAAERIFGWASAEVLGDRPAFLDAAGTWESGDTVATRKDGRRIDVRVSAAPLRGPGGESLGFIGLFEDITELKLAEIDRMRLIAAIEQAPAAFSITGIDDHIVYVNPSFEEAMGYTFQEALGQPTDMLAGDGEPASFWLGIWQSQQAGVTWRGTVPTRRKDGSQFQAELIVAPIRDAAGDVINYLYVARDITRERSLEEQLRQTQKMEAIGRLAGGVAHDFNNLLTAITGFTHLLSSQLPAGDPRGEYTAQVLKAAEQAASLTQQLLAFSRRDVVQPMLIDLNAVVANSDKLLRRLIGEDIQMSTRLAEATRYVYADRGQMEQIVMNLAVNARDAMPRGGLMTIETAFVDAVPGEDALFAPAIQWMRLSVLDAGVGMDEATKARIFEPFFTTKGHGGTGLGLATVYAIVQQNGGQIRVESTLGLGTRFDVYLPIASEQGPGEDGAAVMPGWASDGRRESVLLVEDEPGVREYIVTLLAEMGHDVIAAASGEEALRILADGQCEIDVLVTDVVMPGLSGRELAERLRATTPGLAILFMSGYTDDAIVRHGISQDEVVFLQKPFQPASFGLKLREAIERSRRKRRGARR